MKKLLFCLIMFWSAGYGQTDTILVYYSTDSTNVTTNDTPQVFFINNDIHRKVRAVNWKSGIGYKDSGLSYIVGPAGKDFDPNSYPDYPNDSVPTGTIYWKEESNGTFTLKRK